MAAALWHDDLAQRWNWFVTDLRRTLDLDVQFMKTYEPQERGALHAHAMARLWTAWCLTSGSGWPCGSGAERQGFGPLTDL